MPSVFFSTSRWLRRLWLSASSTRMRAWSSITVGPPPPPVVVAVGKAGRLDGAVAPYCFFQFRRFQWLMPSSAATVTAALPLLVHSSKAERLKASS